MLVQVVLEEHGKVQVHKLCNLCFYARRSAEAINDYSVGERNSILRRRQLSCALPVNHHLVVRKIDLHLIHELLKWFKTGQRDVPVIQLLRAFVPGAIRSWDIGDVCIDSGGCLRVRKSACH